jgi:hypothetical protein
MKYIGKKIYANLWHNTVIIVKHVFPPHCKRPEILPEHGCFQDQRDATSPGKAKHNGNEKTA